MSSDMPSGKCGPGVRGSRRAWSRDKSSSARASYWPDENEATLATWFIAVLLRVGERRLLSAAGALTGDVPVRQRIAGVGTGGTQSGKNALIGRATIPG
jgi:hypothetical protein